MAQTYTNLLAHLVFSTKDRNPCLDDAVCAELYPYLVTILHEHEAKTLAIGGWFDHVHILASLSSKHAVSDLMRELKANSSGWMKRRFPENKKFAWQSGFSAFSVSHSNIGAVRKYIERQHEHHERVSFKEELVAFLEKQGIQYDPKYIWE